MDEQDSLDAGETIRANGMRVSVDNGRGEYTLTTTGKVSPEGNVDLMFYWDDFLELMRAGRQVGTRCRARMEFWLITTPPKMPRLGCDDPFSRRIEFCLIKRPICAPYLRGKCSVIPTPARRWFCQLVELLGKEVRRYSSSRIRRERCLLNA